MKKCGGVITVMEAPRCDPTALAPLAPGERFIRSVQLGGGLFNQLWTLLGLVFQAAERKLPFVLPTFDSHISPHSMGIRSTEANLPRSVPFAELFDVNCLVGAFSSFSASLAHIRHLDRPVDRYYAYCGAMPALRRSAVITLQPPADTVRIHTCKLRNRTVKSQAGRA